MRLKVTYVEQEWALSELDRGEKSNPSKVTTAALRTKGTGFWKWVEGLGLGQT